MGRRSTLGGMGPRKRFQRVPRRRNPKSAPNRPGAPGLNIKMSDPPPRRLDRALGPGKRRPGPSWGGLAAPPDPTCVLDKFPPSRVKMTPEPPSAAPPRALRAPGRGYFQRISQKIGNSRVAGPFFHFFSPKKQVGSGGAARPARDSVS